MGQSGVYNIILVKKTGLVADNRAEGLIIFFLLRFVRGQPSGPRTPGRGFWKATGTNAPMMIIKSSVFQVLKIV